MTEGTGVIYLQKDKFEFYSPNLGKVIEFRFVPEIMSDLEVVNAELLQNLIKLFVASNKILPGELIIVLADNACFIKDFVSPPLPIPKPDATQSISSITMDNPDLGKLQEDIKFFTDHVPFENVQSRNFPMANGTKVLAVNADFYGAIKEAFEKNQFRVSAVLPGLVFENNLGSKPTMDIITANTIIQRAPMLRNDNLLKEDKSFQPIVENKEIEKDVIIEEPDNKPVKKSNKRLFMMIGIFVILIIVLIFVYVGSLSQTP